jgi:hypothetical protein
MMRRDILGEVEDKVLVMTRIATPPLTLDTLRSIALLLFETVDIKL